MYGTGLMTNLRFLTLFPNLKSVYLAKDVGKLPYYLASCYGWSSAIAFLKDGKENAKHICDEEYEQHVQIIPMGAMGGRVSNVCTVLMFLYREARQFDLLNLYHDSFIHMLFALVYKLFNHRGIVYLKLDIGHLGLMAFQKASQGLFSRFFLWIKGCVSRLVVDVYSVETVSIYNRLSNTRYFRGRLIHLPNGTLFDGMRDLSDIWKAKEKIILSVGNLGAYAKNNELLVDAVVSLPAEAIEGWKVMFVGPFVDVDYYESGLCGDDHFNRYVQTVIEQHPHLAKVLECPGHITDRQVLKKLYDKSSIFCLTSRYEGFPHVLLEAANSACYLVSTDLPAAREMTDNGRFCSIFASDDRNALTEILYRCITGMIQMEEPASAVCRKSSEIYDWRIIASQLDVKLCSLYKGSSCG